jgi:hypothetical protein
MLEGSYHQRLQNWSNSHHLSLIIRKENHSLSTTMKDTHNSSTTYYDHCFVGTSDKINDNHKVSSMAKQFLFNGIYLFISLWFGPLILYSNDVKATSASLQYSLHTAHHLHAFYKPLEVYARIMKVLQGRDVVRMLSKWDRCIGAQHGTNLKTVMCVSETGISENMQPMGAHVNLHSWNFQPKSTQNPHPIAVRPKPTQTQ